MFRRKKVAYFLTFFYKLNDSTCNHVCFCSYSRNSRFFLLLSRMSVLILLHSLPCIHLYYFLKITLIWVHRFILCFFLIFIFFSCWSCLTARTQERGIFWRPFCTASMESSWGCEPSSGSRSTTFFYSEWTAIESKNERSLCLHFTGRREGKTKE